MGDRRFGERIAKSFLYGRMRNRAMDYVRDPDRLDALVAKARRKGRRSRDPLRGAFDTLFTFIRLVRAYSKKEYVDISKRTLALVLATIIYFIFPTDLIPDFLVGFGLIDDAALIAWTAHSLKSELDRFREWESGKTGDDE